MSFAEQERALFDLLFNAHLRENFIKNAATALVSYQLSAAELADFSVINPHALALDAKVRVELILGQWCRAFPLTFSLLSSLSGGLLLLRRLVDSQTMRYVPTERVVVFAQRLRQALIDEAMADVEELSLIVAIVDAELGMATTSERLKNVVVKGQYVPTPIVTTDICLTQPVTVAPYVSAAIIPLPYEQLKKALCPCLGAELWRHLQKTPLLASKRQRLWQQADARLLVAKAKVSVMSDCEPTVDHVTFELAEGFASLFEYVNGTMSVQQILQQLQQMNAPVSLVKGIKASFEQLLQQQVLICLTESISAIE